MSVKNFKIRIFIQDFIIGKISTNIKKAALHAENAKKRMQMATQILHINGGGEIERLSLYDRKRYQIHISDAAFFKSISKEYLEKSKTWIWFCNTNLAKEIVYEKIIFELTCKTFEKVAKDIAKRLERIG